MSVPHPRRDHAATSGHEPALLLLTLALLACASSTHAQAATQPGAPTAEHPTFHNLSIVWPIQGDENQNGVVSVRYRPAGEANYRAALPLFRVPAGETEEGFTWANVHAGSVFALKPGTTYDVELQLSDGDGGSMTTQLSVTTRALPTDPPQPMKLEVTPATLAALLESAAPGTIFELADGNYGEVVVPLDGAAGNPIVLRARTRHGAIVEGDVRIDGRAFVHVDGLTVRGKIKFNDAHDIVVRNCRVETEEDGIIALGEAVSDVAVLDNTIQGATSWAEASLGVDGDNIGEGIQLTGPGHIIAFNRVSGFRDCISLLEDDEAFDQRAVDIYGNDLTVCADDGIEADFSMGNVRVYQNRITDSFMGISSQPSLGGPAYFVRNVMHNIVFQAFKLQRGSTGDIGLHNTVVKSGDALSVNTDTPIARAFFRNNLFIGGPGGSYNGFDSGDGRVIDLPTAQALSSFDYDGFGSTANTFTGELGDASFQSLAELRANTTEAHAIQVSLADFEAEPAFPAAPFDPYPVPRFGLSTNAACIDVGVVLENINGDYTGDAPDLGAVERGAVEPTYGPGGNLPGDGGGSTGGGTSAGESGGTNGQNGGVSPGGDGGVRSGGDGVDTPEAGAHGGCACGVAPNLTGAPMSLAMAFWLLRRRRRR